MTAAEFIADALRNPETGKPFELTEAELNFLYYAFQLDEHGRLRFPELVFAAIKKSGKSGFAAMIMLYVTLVLGGRFAEGYCIANDLEQAQGRVFQAVKRIVLASPRLNKHAVVTVNKIEFPEIGAAIQAVPTDYAGAAGANPSITCFDELWGYTSERSRRLWDEMIPPPTRTIACRLTTTYAGFEGESALLQDLYQRGLKQPLVAPDLHAGDGVLMFWSHKPIASWQTDAWLAQMRQQLRPNQYLRMIENRWVTSESEFIPLEWWDRCVEPNAVPVMADPRLAVWVGVDASVKRDSTAIVACTWEDDTKRVRLVWHRVFQPSPSEPLDFEATIEATLRQLRQRFRVRAVNFDPYQMQAVAQRLRGEGVPMVEFPQTVPNLVELATNLYELIKARSLATYPDSDIRLAVSRSVAVEAARGWRIAKEKQAHKIDVVIALGMAALGAVIEGQTRRGIVVATENVYGPNGQLLCPARIIQGGRGEFAHRSWSRGEPGISAVDGKRSWEWPVRDAVTAEDRRQSDVAADQ